MGLFYITVIIVGGVFLVLLIVSLVLMKSGRIKSDHWIERPLGLPTGSVRALLAIIILLVAIWVATSGDSEAIEKIPEWLLGILGAVIGFYFGNRGLKLANREDTTIDRLERLKVLNENGTITDEEFREKKKDLLARI